MRFLSADCIIPVTGEPRYNSVLAVTDDGAIEGIFAKEELGDQHIEHYQGILCPGFVNTHCHLELSWAKDMITEKSGLNKFIHQLENVRVTISSENIYKSIETAADQMAASGIVATADIVNGADTFEMKQNSLHYFHTFVEVFGSNPLSANAFYQKALKLKSLFESKLKKGTVSIVPHATYSLSNELLTLVLNNDRSGLVSIHHQENADENLFFMNGSGPITQRRKLFNPDLPDYIGTWKRPMESIAPFFNKEQKILFVHNTVTDQQDIDFIENYFQAAHWCFCPNANMYIENRLPDFDLFRINNCQITLGTDSLASNHQLSIFEEIKTIKLLVPEIGLAELIQWGTLNGALFLGLQDTLGSFEQGKKPGVVFIEDVDAEKLNIYSYSTSRILIPAGI